MAKLTRLVLYTPDGKRAVSLVQNAQFDGKVLRYLDPKTRVEVQTTLPFVLQEIEEGNTADVGYP